MQALKSIKR
ncbi:hypothetical protein Nmel_000589 [Mimus melanotis]